jgi:hypothetical protein
MLLAILPIALSGCDLLAYAMYPGIFDPTFSNPDFTDPDFTDPDFANPQTFTYGKGSATIEITRDGVTETYTLNEVAPSSTYDPMMGAMVTWQNDEGWSVDIFGYDFSGLDGEVSLGSGDVNVRWIHDSDFWTAGTYTSEAGNRCVVTIWQMSARKTDGKANCSSIQWADGANQYAYPPAFIEGEEPFDMSVTFVAEPIEESAGY